jgi:mono/diheme cytochrome c family protein
VLAVLLFAAFWVVLGLGVFFMAFRGGPSAAVIVSPGPRSHAARRTMGWLFAITFIVFGAVLPAVILIGNHNRANAQVGGITLTAAEKHGREIFGQRCGLCHTLAAANAVGKVGPNLDVVQPTEQLVLHTIENGCLQNPPPGSQEACLGQGTMPADVVQGQDATDVAQFVARVAGKE